MTALDQLSKLAAKITAANDARGPLIAQARAEGATWEQIALALQMSRAGVIKIANATTPPTAADSDRVREAGARQAARWRGALDGLADR